tara:strand:+ start:416 stop:625 length:210 start_codon:yes stop_codon:yes gene_type:complete
MDDKQFKAWIDSMENTECNCKKCRERRREERLEDPQECPYPEGSDGELSWFQGVYDLSTTSFEERCRHE